MAASATELRPRGAVALFDAAIRLASRSGGAWALTLPGSAAVLWALVGLVEAVSFGAPLAVPAALFTCAWLFRALCQGAACHHLEAQVLSPCPPTTWQSLRAALARLPSLWIAAGYVVLFNLVTATLSFGLALFFLPALAIAYPATLKGQGHPLRLYGTCRRLLGGARQAVPGVRLMFGVVVLVAFNLHLLASFLIYLARKLAGLDLVYAQRFTSFDNGAWWVIVVALAFVLLEPLRAAVATLLVIDGRVREEGLDLLAAVEQLPRRRAAPGWVLVLVLAVLGATPAKAQGHAEEPGAQGAAARVRQAVAACDGEHLVLGQSLDWGRLGKAEQAAARRLADEVERYVWDENDCERALERLDAAAPAIAEVVRGQDGPGPGATSRAREILARPEFSPLPAARPKAEQAEEQTGQGLWARLRRWLLGYLERLLESARKDPPERRALAGADLGMGVANLVVAVVLVALVGLLLALFLGSSFWRKPPEQPPAEIVFEQAVGGAAGPGNALSRPPETWASLADELAARGEFRQAIRHLYLALLSRLHRAGAIDYDPTLSNWDHCRRFRGHPEWFGAFKEATWRFDFAWYGQADAGPEGYELFRALSAPILEQAPPAARSANG
jgi:hypothetical protein